MKLLVDFSASLSNRQSRRLLMGPVPLRGPMTTGEEDVDLISNEYCSQTSLNCSKR